jgi:preprotein translocase SecE subunit
VAKDTNKSADKSEAASKNSLRQRNEKAAASKDKPKRIRKAASTAAKPVSKAGDVLTAEYHVLPRKENPGFFTKSRRLTPRYFRESWAELKNVTWPGRKETWKLVFAVFVFALTLGIFIALLDYALDQLFRNVIL